MTRLPTLGIGTPVATRVDPIGAFYPAEAYHQDYLELHPDSPCIARFDRPKVQALQRLFPARWQALPTAAAWAVGLRASFP